MATVPWPEQFPGAWDTLTIAGRTFPGLAKVKVKGGQKIDRKDAPGSDGESTTQQGEKAKDVDITHRMWLPAHWDEFEDAFQLIEPIIGKRRPVDIVTSQTAFRRVTSVVIETVEGPIWDEDHRWMEFRYQCLEHKPPPPKNATAKNVASLYGSDQAQVPQHIVNARPETFGSGTGRIGIYDASKASVTQGFARASGSPTNTFPGS